MKKNHLIPVLLQQTKTEYQQFASLPFAVYVVTTNGYFVAYNRATRDFFQLPKQPTFQDNIINYYVARQDRSPLVEKLLKTEKGNWLDNATLDLEIGGEKKFVRAIYKAVWSEEGNIIGILSMLYNITEEERYHRLFNKLPIGVFHFKKETGLVYANPKFVEMVGYKKFKAIKGKHYTDFVAEDDLERAKELREKLFAEKHLKKELQELRCKSGSTFTASLNMVALFDKNGNYTGAEGTIIDVTTETIYQRLINHVPIGLYKVRLIKGEPIIKHCNEYFAKLCGFDSPEQLINKSIKPYHISGKEYNKYIKALEDADNRGEYLKDYILRAYNGNEEVRKYEIHAKLLRNSQGKVTGRVGAEKDVTEIIELQEQVKELTTDIGSVLHTYSSMLVNSKQTMEAVIRAHSTPEIQKNEELDTHKAMEQLKSRIGFCDTAFKKLFEKNEQVQYLNNSMIQQIEHLMSFLNLQKTESYLENQHVGLIREASIRLNSMVNQKISNGPFPKELLKEIKRHLVEILRYCSMISLKENIGGVVEMDRMVSNLRGYIISGNKHNEKRQKVDLVQLTYAIVNDLKEFALGKGVEVRISPKPYKSIITFGKKMDLSRMLSNVVHNSIKYSWVRKGENKAWVSISISNDHKYIKFAAENWGVAITKEEIEQGLVFKLGYRGEKSGDRNRPGTGVGLFDVSKVVQAHKGTIDINSQAAAYYNKSDYNQPFITTVTVKLPLNLL